MLLKSNNLYFIQRESTKMHLGGFNNYQNKLNCAINIVVQQSQKTSHNQGGLESDA
jgi:hypothetical protein